MGEIRDAKLRKGIVYLCGTCETKRLASDLAVKTKPRDPGKGFGILSLPGQYPAHIAMRRIPGATHASNAGGHYDHNNQYQHG